MVLLKRLTIPLFFGLIAFLALYNILFHSNGAWMPGENRVTDYYHFNWSYWWIGYVIEHPEEQLYYTDYVMYPTVANIAYHTLAVFWYPVFAVLQPLAGRFAAFSIITWIAFTLTGWLNYVLLRREGVARGLAVIGGVMLEVTPLLFMAAWWTTVNLMGVFWYPVNFLIWGQVARTVDHRWKGMAWALLQGLVMWCALIHDLQYGMFIGVILAPYILLTFYQASHRLKLIGLGALAFAVFLFLTWQIGLLEALLEYKESKTEPAQGALLYIIPFPDGYLSIPDYWDHNAVGGLIMLLFFGSALYLLLRRQLDRRWFWFGVALIPLVLSLGYEIPIGGTTLKMPYGYIHDWHGGTFRAPGRFGAVFVTPALLFAGLTWTPLMEKLRPRPQLLIVIPLLLAVLAYHSVLESVPVQPTPPIYDFYQQMAEETGDPYDNYVVVEIPVAVGDGIWTIGLPKDLAPQFYGAIHHKRMVVGHFSRAYVDDNWYLLTDHPVLSWLGQRRSLEPTITEPALREMIQDYPVGYFVLHQDAIGLQTTTNTEIIGYFNSLPDLLCPPVVEETAVAWRTTWHPDGCSDRIPPEVEPGIYQIDLGAAGDERYLGWGWYWSEEVSGIRWRWTGVQLPVGDEWQAEIYTDLPPGAYVIEIAAQSFGQERDLELWVNGERIDAATILPDTLQTVRFEVPAGIIGDGKNLKLELRYPPPASPADMGQGSDPRPLSIAVDWIRFVRQ